MANPLRKTMVYLGLADEEFDYEDEVPSAPVAPVAHATQAANRAQVTPLRRPVAKASGSAEMNEILTVHPRQYKDAQVIAENFREGIPVIINLSQMSEPDAKRLIDFASGLCYALNGSMEKVATGVYLLKPPPARIHRFDDYES